MKSLKSCTLVFAFALGSVLFLRALACAESAALAHVDWKPWTDQAFANAGREHKPVLLNLEAVWCHWCHVMEQETYSKPEIAAYINEHYVALKVDQDARPDLSNRYQDYGWPATIFFNANGGEFAKRAGFIEPEEMLLVLKRGVEHPEVVEADETPQSTQLSARTSLPPELKAKLTEKHYQSYDAGIGGLRTSHKFLDSDALEYSLVLSTQKSAKDKDMALQTLTANLKLLDPIWGGVYQYSTHGDWDHPHFEKIMSTQSKNIRLYSLAAAQYQREDFARAARQSVNYLSNFLMSPEGVFFVSQDADLVKGQKGTEYFALSDIERRKQGIPAVDTHVYARENGWAIAALLQFASYAAPDEEFEANVLKARTAADWILKNRKLSGSKTGFAHGQADSTGPFLGDTLSMGSAFLQLYVTTAERNYLTLAEESLQFLATHFLEPQSGAVAAELDTSYPGFLTVAYSPRAALSPVRQLDENIALARFANALSHYTGKTEYRKVAEHVMKYLATDEIALMYITNAGVLLVDRELSTPPLHMTIVGSKKDEQSKKLFRAALHYPEAYRRVEWWDKSEGPLPNADVQYPELPKPAAFVCTDKRCSLPIFKPEDIAKTLERFGR